VSLGRYAGSTDVGRKRRHNEDSYVVAPPLFAVADGMGGANAGEVASGIAVETLKSGDGADFVTLIQEANRRVFKRSSDDASASGMGTTMIAAVVGEETVRFANVGDSRAYVYRDGELNQITQDHSLVGELVRSGKLAPEDAQSHPQRSVITRALGTDPDVDVDTYEVDTRSGDLFLLCSDGLYSMVGHDRMLELIDRHRGDLDGLTKALIGAANRGGGDDNITVVVFEIAAPGEETVRLPAAPAPAAEEEPEPEPEEEETLDETDAVPRVSTMVIRAEDLQAMTSEAAPAAVPEEPDFEPEEAARGRSRLWLLLALLAIAVAILVVVLFATGVL
jgi:serine/threonine protein phosphatase PrpC